MAFVNVEMNLEIYEILKNPWLSKQLLLSYALLLSSLHISVPHFVSYADFIAVFLSPFPPFVFRHSLFHIVFSFLLILSVFTLKASLPHHRTPHPPPFTTTHNISLLIYSKSFLETGSTV